MLVVGDPDPGGPNASEGGGWDKDAEDLVRVELGARGIVLAAAGARGRAGGAGIDDDGGCGSSDGDP